jgi:hypothetical protein
MPLRERLDPVAAAGPKAEQPQHFGSSRAGSGEMPYNTQCQNMFFQYAVASRSTLGS